MYRTLALAVASLMISSASAQTAQTYQVPRTEFGQPDFQGVWSARFNTMLERPPGVPLVLPLEGAAGFAQVVADNIGDNTDPDIDRLGPPALTVVNGEHRTSVVVYPENGILPYNELGASLAGHSYFEGDGYDHPEQRPAVERCIEA